MSSRFILFITSCVFIATLQAQQTDTLLIHFSYNRPDITSAASNTIDSFLLKNINQFVIRQIALYGHCDSIGSNLYNDHLSQARVASARQYFLMKNIPADAFTKTTGFGKRQPLNSNTTEAERLLNRRVEIIIYKDAIVKQEPQKITPPPDKPASGLAAMINDTTTKVGSTLVLPNLHFLGGRHYLMPQSEPVLRELFQALQANAALRIEIQGHICCEPPQADGFDADVRTYDLSIQRAKYIFEWLVRAGIDPSRMSYRGFGASRKLFPADRPGWEQEQNRRVEIRILSK